MLQRCRYALLILAAAVLAGSATAAESLTSSLKAGSPELKSAGPLAFGPEGILFVGDPKTGTIYAIDTGDRTAPSTSDRPMVEQLDQKIASLLGTEAGQIQVRDMAVNPISGNTYLSVARGRGPDATPVLLRVGRDGKVSEFALKDVKQAQAKLSSVAGGNRRQEAITHMAFVKGKLIVAGLSSEDFDSRLRVIPFPFKETDNGTTVEFFHGSHGKLETNSPVRTFVPYEINKEAHLLAAYTCTPLVKIPVSELKPGAKIKGTTIAELGNRNRPLGMIVYQKGGRDYLLIANNARGLMKVPTEGIDKVDAISQRVRNTAGLPYEKVKGVEGVVQLDLFDKDHALVLQRAKDGEMTLKTIELP